MPKPKTLAELLAYNPPYQEPLISNSILNVGQRLILFGRYDTFKSMMAAQMLFTIGAGKSWLGFATTPSSGLYIPLEETELELKKRVEKYALTHQLYPSNIYFCHMPMLKLDDASGFSLVDAMLGATNARLLILDPYFKLVRSELDEMSVNHFVDNIDMLIYRHSVSVVIVTHDSKGVFEAGLKIDRGADDIRGLNTLPRWADNVIRFDLTAEDRITLSFLKLKAAEQKIAPIRLKFNRATLELQKV